MKSRNEFPHNEFPQPTMYSEAFLLGDQTIAGLLDSIMGSVGQKYLSQQISCMLRWWSEDSLCLNGQGLLWLSTKHLVGLPHSWFVIEWRSGVMWAEVVITEVRKEERRKVVQAWGNRGAITGCYGVKWGRSGKIKMGTRVSPWSGSSTQRVFRGTAASSPLHSCHWACCRRCDSCVPLGPGRKGSREPVSIFLWLKELMFRTIFVSGSQSYLDFHSWFLASVCSVINPRLTEAVDWPASYSYSRPPWL